MSGNKSKRCKSISITFTTECGKCGKEITSAQAHFPWAIIGDYTALCDKCYKEWEDKHGRR